MTGIYKITNPKKMIYIGQSIDIKSRWGEYRRLRGCGVNTRLLNSLKKYGFENHIFEIIHECEAEKLNQFEIFYIELFQSFNTADGLNLHSGGNNHTVSDETREKLRLSHLGQKVWNKGIPRTNEQRLAHSIKMTGRKASEETKLKMGVARKGATHSEETKKN